jgi:hypothetical protein
MVDRAEALFGDKPVSADALNSGILSTSTGAVNVTFVAPAKGPGVFGVVVRHVFSRDEQDGKVPASFTVHVPGTNFKFTHTGALSNAVLLDGDLMAFLIKDFHTLPDKGKITPVQMEVPVDQPLDFFFHAWNVVDGTRKLTWGRFFRGMHTAGSVDGNCSTPLMSKSGRVIAFHQGCNAHHKLNIAIPVTGSMIQRLSSN